MVSTHISGDSNEIEGRTFIFRVNLGMWPLKLIVLEKRVCSESSNTHLCSFQADRWKNIHFSTKPGHVTPHVSPVPHLWGFQIDGSSSKPRQKNWSSQ